MTGNVASMSANRHRAAATGVVGSSNPAAPGNPGCGVISGAIGASTI
jgi:hypothetical protein